MAQSNPLWNLMLPWRGKKIAMGNWEKFRLFRDLGRNDKCACGSGKKFKKCCINVDWTKEVA